MFDIYYSEHVKKGGKTEEERIKVEDDFFFELCEILFKNSNPDHSLKILENVVTHCVSKAWRKHNEAVCGMVAQIHHKNKTYSKAYVSTHSLFTNY